jgi:lipoprotein NlpI
VGLNNPRQLAERLCEAYFYLAKWHQARGDANQALIYYHKTLATNVYEFVEHRYARMEMAKLRGDELSNEQHDFE